MSASGSQGGLQRLGQGVANWSERWVPSPFIFAIVLTVIAYMAAIVLTPDGPLANVVNWYDGFWELLEFAMQMVLVLVTGYAVADSKQVSGLLNRIASLPDTGPQAAALVAAVAMLAGYFHWGVGLIIGAIFAVFVARAGYQRGKTFHYPLLCAAGYTSQVIWHVGPSTSAGLLSATEGHVFEDVIGVVPLLYFLAPSQEHSVGIEEYAPELLNDDEREKREVATDGGERFPSERLNDSRLIAYVVATGMMVYLGQHFATAGLGEALDLNVFNFLFIALGLFLYGTPTAYMGAIRDATESSAGIILQFPFYAGILGIVENSGLSDLVSELLLDLATPATFPVLAWLLGGIMNFFAPSGGGEWAIIGGIIGETAVELGVEPGQAIIAYGTGDMWTNMFQPFWAIPLLGITKVKARDILGYTLIIMIVLTPVFALGLYFLPY